jgi:hypothetical protein
MRNYKVTLYINIIFLSKKRTDTKKIKLKKKKNELIHKKNKIKKIGY